jgi:hypothetical protein
LEQNGILGENGDSCNNLNSKHEIPSLPKNLFGGQAKFETGTNVQNLNAPNKQVLNFEIRILELFRISIFVFRIFYSVISSGEVQNEKIFIPFAAHSYCPMSIFMGGTGCLS